MQCNQNASSSLATALQVLDDNIWEQRAQSHQQASSSCLDLPADMETDAVLPAPHSQQAQQTPEAAVHSQQLPRAPAEFVPGGTMEVPSDRRAVAPAEQPSKRARMSAPAQRPPRWGRGCERVLVLCKRALSSRQEASGCSRGMTRLLVCSVPPTAYSSSRNLMWALAAGAGRGRPLSLAYCMRAAVVCCPQHSSQPGFLVLRCVEAPVNTHAMLYAASCQMHDHQLGIGIGLVASRRQQW